MVEYLEPELAASVELDVEAGMFAAYGDPATLARLQLLLDPYLEDGDRVAETIRSAEAAGFQLDD
jgi:hypothetical protein